QKVEQFRVIEPAVPPRKASAPTRVRLLLAGLFVSLAAAAAAAFAAEKLDTSFHGVDDLRAFTRIPALFAIPLIPSRAETRRRRVRIAIAAVSAVMALGLVIAGVRHIAMGNERI